MAVASLDLKVPSEGGCGGGSDIRDFKIQRRDGHKNVA